MLPVSDFVTILSEDSQNLMSLPTLYRTISQNSSDRYAGLKD